MKNILLVLVLLILIPFEAYALSCNFKHELIVKCDQGKCQKGFIIPRKMTGFYCERILNVMDSTEIEAIDPSLEILNDIKNKNGFYILQCTALLNSNPKDYFKVTTSKFLTVDCSKLVEEPMKIILQDYSASLSIEEVRRKLVIESRIEETINLLMNLLLPALITVLLIGLKRYQKYEIVIVISLFIISCIGITQLLWGRRSWAIFGIIGISLISIWLIRKLIQKIKKK